MSTIYIKRIIGNLILYILYNNDPLPLPSKFIRDIEYGVSIFNGVTLEEQKVFILVSEVMVWNNTPRKIKVEEVKQPEEGEEGGEPGEEKEKEEEPAEKEEKEDEGDGEGEKEDGEKEDENKDKE